MLQPVLQPQRTSGAGLEGRCFWESLLRSSFLLHVDSMQFFSVLRFCVFVCVSASWLNSTVCVCLTVCMRIGVCTTCVFYVDSVSMSCMCAVYVCAYV